MAANQVGEPVSQSLGQSVWASASHMGCPRIPTGTVGSLLIRLSVIGNDKVIGPLYALQTYPVPLTQQWRNLNPSRIDLLVCHHCGCLLQSGEPILTRRSRRERHTS